MKVEELNKYFLEFEYKFQANLNKACFSVVNNKKKRLKMLNNLLAEYKYSGEIENYKIHFKENDSEARCQVQLSNAIYSIFNFYVCMEM